MSIGASFTGSTVKINVSVFEFTIPSLAVTLISPLPIKFPVGVKVKVEPVTDTAIFSVLLTAL